MKTLIISRNVERLFCLINLFRYQTFTSIGAISLREAFDQLKLTRFDIIISDFKLGKDASALECLQFLKHHSQWVGTPDVVVFSQESKEFLEQNLSLGLYPKPNYICQSNLDSLYMRVNPLID